MRVILHDAEQNRASALIDTLGREGVSVEALPRAAIQSGAAGLDEDVASLMPIILGFEKGGEAAGTVPQMRAAGATNPLLVLQEGLRPDETARVIDAGADDVVGAPFNHREILARLRSLTRRHFGVRSQEVTSGSLTVFLDGRYPEVEGRPIRLSASEVAILRILALNLGKVVRRDALFDALYALADYQPYMKAIDVHICKLRKKIEAHTVGGANWIRTYAGQGYALQKVLPAHQQELERHPPA